MENWNSASRHIGLAVLFIQFWKLINIQTVGAIVASVNGRLWDIIQINMMLGSKGILTP